MSNNSNHKVLYNREEMIDSNYATMIESHMLLSDLKAIAEFYRAMSYNCFLFLPNGTHGWLNYNSYLFESIAGTISSIDEIVKKGRLNDACVLLRFYFDNIYTDTYIQITLKNKFNVFNNFYVSEVEEWLQRKHRIPSIKKIVNLFETNDISSPIYLILNKDNRLVNDREFLDDCVHGNKYQALLYNCSALCLEHRGELLLHIQSILKTLFTLHFSFIFSLNPHYLMASDYKDCLDMGLTPPPGSEYWISPFAQEAFNMYVNPNKELSDYLCTTTDLIFIEK
jgi:hypothetical protein